MSELAGMILNFSFEQIVRDAEAAFFTAIADTMVEVERDARAAAPVDTGNLQDHIKAGVALAKKGKFKGCIVGWCKARGIKYGWAVESGHGSYPPHPFMRPAIDKNRDGVDKRFKIQ